ncbi:MAG: rRNA pseudouridine synthase [Oscillatoriales cyanobacterium]|nr:MAG: rRNA pseudouridine synthase [Oscillatoriales cyanobacterium]
MEARLQKVLAKYGVASRRRAEQLIEEGRVWVNGQPASIGLKVDPDRDVITVDGQTLTPATPSALYILLNKPLGVVSTCHDPQRRPTVLDCLPEDLTRHTGLHPIGRLDTNSTGALILTNDGDLTYQLSHPRHHVPKTYRVWVRGVPSATTLKQWRSGVWLDDDDRPTLPAQVNVLQIQPHHGCDQTELEIVLREGRNRQIRRVATHLGHPVINLHRCSIGIITLKTTTGADLKLGEYRHLTPAEVQQLQTHPRRTDAEIDKPH